MKEFDDMSLFALFKEGNVKAYEQLFRRYYKLLTAEAFYILGDDMEAEDQVQLLFIEIWDKKSFMNINTSVKSYFRIAIKNKCLTIIDKRKTVQKRIDVFKNDVGEYVDANVMEKYETEQQINSILSDLPVQRLEAFTLVYLEDKKYKEAAEEMGITVNSIKTHLKLAVKTLREKNINFE